MVFLRMCKSCSYPPSHTCNGVCERPTCVTIFFSHRETTHITVSVSCWVTKSIVRAAEVTLGNLQHSSYSFLRTGDEFFLYIWKPGIQVSRSFLLILWLEVWCVFESIRFVYPKQFRWWWMICNNLRNCGLIARTVAKTVQVMILVYFLEAVLGGILIGRLEH